MSDSLQRAATAARVLRPMCADDVDAVMAIETQSYEQPWTHGIFHDCLRVGYICRILADSNGAVAAYGVMSIGAGECHLLNICVAPAFRGRGCGRELVTALLAHARGERVTMALLEVRRSNSAAYRLYAALGFDEIGTRRNYYPTRAGREDALLLARAL